MGSLTVTRALFLGGTASKDSSTSSSFLSVGFNILTTRRGQQANYCLPSMGIVRKAIDVEKIIAQRPYGYI